MTVHLILRFATAADASRSDRPSRERVAWLALGAALLVLSLLTALGCTSGGGPASTPAVTTPTGGGTTGGSTVAYFTEADGGDQKSSDGKLDNQGVIGQDLSLKATTSADGTLQNQGGFNP